MQICSRKKENRFRRLSQRNVEEFANGRKESLPGLLGMLRILRHGGRNEGGSETVR